MQWQSFQERMSIAHQQERMQREERERRRLKNEIWVQLAWELGAIAAGCLLALIAILLTP